MTGGEELDPAGWDFVELLRQELLRADPDLVQVNALDAALRTALVGKPRAVCLIAVLARVSGLLRDGDGEVRDAFLAAMPLLVGGALQIGDDMARGVRH